MPLWEKSSKRFESETQKRLCGIALGLAEPEERNSSNFSWSNSTMSDTVLPRSQTSGCAMAFSSEEKELPSGIAIFCLVSEKSDRCKVSLSG